MKFLHLSALATLIGCQSIPDDSQSEDSFGSGDIDFTECDGQVEFLVINVWKKKHIFCDFFIYPKIRESCDLSVKFPTLAIRTVQQPLNILSEHWFDRSQNLRQEQWTPKDFLQQNWLKKNFLNCGKDLSYFEEEQLKNEKYGEPKPKI